MILAIAAAIAAVQAPAAQCPNLVTTEAFKCRALQASNAGNSEAAAAKVSLGANAAAVAGLTGSGGHSTSGSPGNGSTPLQAASGPLRPFDNPGYLPTTRAVIDLADVEASRWSLAGGQSGNPRSPHYRDLFDLWYRGEAIPIPWSEEAVAAATTSTLLLAPRG